MVVRHLPTGSRGIANGLHWVHAEIERSLTSVRGYLEQYLEGVDDDDHRPLLDAVDALSQVRGTVRMLQCHGAASLADEMLKLLQMLVAGNIESHDAAYDALSSASLLLSDYIELLALGEPDRVIVLQPALNELRLARGKPLRTEADLFAMQLQASGVDIEPPTASTGEAQALARNELNAFQGHFLQWFRGREPEAALHGMNEIAARLADAVVAAPLRRLWWSVTLLTESLAGGDDDALELKRLLGRVGMQLRLLADRGEAEAAAAVGDSADLLLYHLVLAPQPSLRSHAMIVAQQLQEILPDNTTLEQVRRRLRLPNASVLERVHLEFRRDLQQVKDAIDLVVRTRSGAGADLEMQRQRLLQLADTLGVLGLQGPQQVLANQAKIVVGLDAESPAWIDTATALLRVEHSLEEALFRAQGRYHKVDARDYSEIEAEVPHSRDLREAAAALLRESLADLAQVKTAAAAGIGGAATGVATEVARLLTEVAAGLKIIGRERASELVHQVAQCAAGDGLAGIGHGTDTASHAADAIACIELYLEALRDGLPQSDDLLDHLEACTARLQSRSIAETAAAATETAIAAPAAPRAAGASPETAAISPEIRDIFTREATAVLASLQHDLPGLRLAQDNPELLTSVRRAFHTLKGSGHMAGASHIAAAARAVEQVLDRCLEGALAVRTAVLDLATDATSLLPGLIAHFRSGDATDDVAVQALLQRAEQLRVGTDDGGTGMYEVFRADARERLAVVSRWLDAQDAGAADSRIEPDVIRAFHTLHGSAGLVGAVPVERIAQAFEAYLNAALMVGGRLSAAGLDLMREAVSKLGGWIETGAGAGLGDAALGECLQRVHALQAELPSPQPVAGVPEGRALDRDAFTVQALETLQAVEADLLDWHTQEQGGGAGQSVGEGIGSRLDALAADAQVHGCPPMAGVSAALAERLRAVVDAPSPALVAALEDVLEGLFQQLDAFRAGEPVEEAAPLLDQIAGLPVAPPRIPGVGVVAPAEPSVGVQPPAPASVADPELREIFLSEAGELLIDYRQALQQLGQTPGVHAPLAALRRILHTLKGSARMAGLEAVGSACQHYEQSAIAAEDSPAQVQTQLPVLQQAEQELHLLLVEAGAVFDEHVLSIPAVGSAAVVPGSGREIVAGTTWDGNAPARAGVQIVLPSSTAAGAVDADLTAVFSAEAGELLESLDRAFDALRGGDDNEAAQDMRRALHTLKGGARAVGLDRMGDVAHQMETRLEQALATDHASNESALQSLRVDLDQLHQMHDALRRGEQAVVQTAPAPAAPAPAGVASPWNAELFWRPDGESAQGAALRREYARVPVDALNSMLNQSGEISIFRARLEQHNSGLRTQLTEMTQTIARVRGQLRMMDMETEAQIAARGLNADTGHGDPDRYGQDFDPLELDRYSRMQELSRALAEAINDLSSLYGLLDQGVNETDTLLQLQGRIGTQVQQGLMSTLMVPFSRQQPRLERVVRQSALDAGKRVELYFDGIATELDRNVLERIADPLAHLLRNAVVHGIESPAQRHEAGKPDSGRIEVRVRREAEQLLIELADDGSGLDFSAIRAKAVERGQLPEDAQLSEDDLARFIFEPGFTTARELTQNAGRGIGLDVVASSIRQLGGTLELRSSAGQGTRFLVRLPLTLAVSQALVVVVGSEHYAVPLPAIVGVVRIPVSELHSRLASGAEPLGYAGQDYPVHYLGEFLDLNLPVEIETRSVVALLVRAGETLTGEERRVALVVDELQGNRELICKAIGPQLSAVPGIAGASILADGNVVLILDVPTLVTEHSRRAHLVSRAPQVAVRDTVMVVDDSITMRRVAQRLLERAGYRVVIARDGLDAIALLQSELPAVVLLDIEMPRSDGFEVASFIRNNERLARVPIIMITSRSGDKHRERARRLGVDRYLIKPYQEDQLLQEVRSAQVRTDG